MHNQIERTLTSLEVAEMINKTHANLLKDIKRYCKQLAEVKINLGDFFQESTYKDTNNQERPCYKITKKGCEFIAHKLTGIKGTEFTARYINRFHDMEGIIEEISEYEKKPQSQVPFKEQLEGAAFIADDLRVSQSNKIMMFRLVCENNHVPSNFLPAYAENEGREAKPATELLKAFHYGMTAASFNKLLLDAGILEERERRSTSSKTRTKKYKALTEKGLQYGKNLTCAQNVKETQPYYYVDAFQELFTAVMQAVEARDTPPEH